MPYDPKQHRHPFERALGRRSIRLPGYDYAQAGAYFVTICTHQRQCLFGDVTEGQMVPNEPGRIAQACWGEIPAHFPHVELDAFVVMPNHVHGIIVIVDHGRGTACRVHEVGATHASPQPPRGPKHGSLGAIVGSFKSAATRRINQLRDTPGQPVWQRNYYERIIRNESALDCIRSYIEANPARWPHDRENPHRRNIDDFDLEMNGYHPNP